MKLGSPFDSSQSFIEIARQRDMLSDDQAKSLMKLTAERSVMSSRLAVDLGMLMPVDVEIIEAFLAPNDLAPGYELMDVLGYGALGVVYRARQPRLQRDVAIKAILQSRLDQQNVLARFQQEGALIGRLQHPNIVSAYDFGSHRDRLYLVMELVHGCDLSRRLDQGPIPTSTGLAIVRQTAAGLAHALSHQIIHRDIKPGNLLLTDAPTGFDLPPEVPLVKIVDFGLARFNRSAEIDEQDTRLTVTGSALGTPMYCAPEQISGDEIDHRADIYALGASFFRILTGETPFESTKVSKIIAAKVTGQSPRVAILPSGLDPAVKDLLLDMMHSDPEERIPDYETLIERIDEIGEVKGSRASRSTGASLIPAGEANAAGANSGPRHRLNRSLLLSVVALIAIGLAWLWVSRLLQPRVAATMVRSGWQSHLFDGRTMTGWNVRGGLWNSGVDSEGGSVLVGRGAAARKLPPSPATTGDSESGNSESGDSALEDNGIGVRLGVDLQDAEWAEIHFGFRDQASTDATRLIVRVSPRGVLLGSKTDAKAEFKSLGDSLEMPVRDGDQPQYHEVRIERHGSNWFAFFDDQQLGSAPAQSAEGDTEMLLVTDGTVHFEGPIVYQLSPPAVSAE